MKEIKVKCPAKINLTLEVLDKRPDGFHNIQSVMQTIDLFDILTIKAQKSETFEIKLSGTSSEIPYDERNLVYKAAELFSKKIPFSADIHIEKNIPIAAGLAGGSTDAVGVLFGLNEIFEHPYSQKELHELCAQLGSDLNFCLEGGCQLATSRGEILQRLPFAEFRLSLIKPKNLGISAKEAYQEFANLNSKPNKNMTEKMLKALKSNENISEFLYNDLETAIIDNYKELQKIKKAYPEAIMSGSGSTFFILQENIENISDDYWVKTALKSISHGIQIM